jgi:hypothetical protein
LESRYKYGLLGAGAVSASLIGKLPARARELGPVSAVSYRVASRLANTLGAGFPVRATSELSAARCILFHALPEFIEPLLEQLERAQLDWSGKCLVICDCAVDREIRRSFQAKGAATAVARQFQVAGRMIVEADETSGAAMRIVHRIARELHMKAIGISPTAPDLLAAAVTLGGAAITPLIDQAAALLRASGVKDIEAVRIASSLFEQSARDYAHSGKQSWAWYVRKPSLDHLRAQIEATGPLLDPIFRDLLLFAFQTFGKHEEIGSALVAESSK